MDPLPTAALRRGVRSTSARRLAGWLAPLTVVLSAGADGTGDWLIGLQRLGERVAAEALAWYGRTPASERVTWAALACCAGLGLAVTLERSCRLRRGRIVPEAFVERFLRRLSGGQLDRGKALDYCELNPSPAARVALAAVQRWGRSAADLERGAAMARQREVDALRLHVGTLRRIAALAPLVGLLGTLTAAGRILGAMAPGAALGPALAGALGPLTAGVALAILALVFYDGLMGRVEALASALDRIAAESVDAIALASPADPNPKAGQVSSAGPSTRPPHAVFIPAPRSRAEP
jgi:biopolymer transport protein ExbB